MMEEQLSINLALLKKNFEENNVNIFPSDIDEIKTFQDKYNVEIPLDLRYYFLKVNGSGNETLDNLYEFYSINRTQKIHEELINWRGVPDYGNLNFEGIENVFIFGKYEFNLYAFGIELHQNLLLDNRIFIMCGNHFKIITNSFTEFIDLYLNRPEGIFI